MRDQQPPTPGTVPASWRRLLESHPREVVFSATLLLALVARMTSFSLGYAVDDYAYLSDDRALAITARPLLLSQGRFGLVLLVDVLRWLGLNVSGDYVVGAALLTLSLVWLALTGLRLAGLTEHVSFAAAAAFIIVLQPYQVEYFTFREALLLVSVPTAMTALALSLNRPSVKRIMLSAMLILAGIAIWQETLVLFAVTSLFALSCRFLCNDGPDISVRARAAARESNLPANLISAVAALLLYVPLLWLVVRVSGWKLAGRAQLLSVAEIPLRARQTWGLIVNLLLKSEPIFPRGPKLLLLALFVVSALAALFHASRRRKQDGLRPFLVSGLVLPAALLGCSIAAVIPLHIWWPVPRTLIAVGWLWAYLAVCSLVWLDRYAGKRALGAGMAVLAVVAFAMIGLNNQVLTDQLRLNIRDREQMNRIIGRLEATPGFDKVSRLMIVGGAWGYASPIATVQGDLNSSAFFPEGSKFALAREISGYGFQMVDAPGEASRLRAICATGEKWPSIESVQIAGEAAVVCLPEVH